MYSTATYVRDQDDWYRINKESEKFDHYIEKQTDNSDKPMTQREANGNFVTIFIFLIMIAGILILPKLCDIKDKLNKK